MDTHDKDFSLAVSEDNMQAVLDCRADAQPIDILAARVHRELERMGVANIPPLDTLEAELAGASRQNPAIVGLVVARGKEMIPSVDGKIIWARDFFNTDFAVDKKTGAIDYRRRVANLGVKKGELLATLVAPLEGSEGRNLYGKSIVPAHAKPVMVKAGPNVSFDEQKSAYLAADDGRFRLSNNVLAVDYVYTINGNVGIESGDVSHEGSLTITGDVETGSVIEAAGDVEVHGSVECANITAKGTLTVRGGITGGKDRLIKAGGSVLAKFILEAHIEAGEDVVAEKEIIQSVVKARGAVKVPAGRIVGGEVIALGGVIVGQAGSDGNVRTVIVAGEDYTLAPQVEIKQAKADKLKKQCDLINTKVKPLLATGKLLSHKQREVATELICQVDVMESEAEEMNKEVESLRSDARARAVHRVTIGAVAFCETHLRIEGVELHIQKNCRGPVVARYSDDKIVLEPSHNTQEQLKTVG